MKILLRIAIASAWHRRFALIWTVIGLAVSSALVIGLSRTSIQTGRAFQRSLPNADLVVGPRGAAHQILLQSVFHVGNAQHLMSWNAVKKLRTTPGVSWVLPLSFGETFGGFPVVGTDSSMFRIPWGAENAPPQIAEGRGFDGLFEVVLGDQVARKMHLGIGGSVALVHGGPGDLDDDDDDHDGPGHHHTHADKPFRVTGILRRSHTPLDRSLFVSLESLTALHLDWVGGAPMPGFHLTEEQTKKFNLTPKSVSAALVGLDDPSSSLFLSRKWNEDAVDPVTAFQPRVVLDEIRSSLGDTEGVVRLAALASLLAALAGMLATQFASSESRRAEFAVLRLAGAKPIHLLFASVVEAVLTAGAGVAAGWVAVQLALPHLEDRLGAHLGVTPDLGVPVLQEALWIGLLLSAAAAAGILPLLVAMRRDLVEMLPGRS
jgi:putative ABC transport system permease protein